MRGRRAAWLARRAVLGVVVGFALGLDLGQAATPAASWQDGRGVVPEGRGPVGVTCATGEIHDDGVADDGYGWNPDLVQLGSYVERFTPLSYPFTYTQACLCWLRNRPGTTLDYTLEAWDDDGPDGTPGTLLGSLPATAADIPDALPGAFYSVDLTPLGLTIASGSIYLGARWNPTQDPGFFLCADETLLTPRHLGWARYNDVPFVPTPALQPGYRALLVRADGVGPPLLLPAGWRTDDRCLLPASQQNSIPEPGEEVLFAVDLEARYGAFSEVHGTLTCATPGATVTVGAAAWPELPAGEVRTSTAPLRVRLDRDLGTCHRTLDCTVTVTAAEGGPFTVELQEPIGQSLQPEVPATIPDLDLTGLRSSLRISEDVVLNEVGVRVVIDHPFIGDLIVVLIGPAGAVVLLDRPGVPPTFVGCPDDDLQITFEDSAATTAAELEARCLGTTPWYAGSAQPVEPLNRFAGTSAAGTWTLWVLDAQGGDTGTLIDWELITEPQLRTSCGSCQQSGGPEDGVVAVPTLGSCGRVALACGLIVGAVLILRERLRRTV